MKHLQRFPPGTSYHDITNFLIVCYEKSRLQRLKVAQALPDSDLLTEELTRFRSRPTIAQEPQECWREGDRISQRDSRIRSALVQSALCEVMMKSRYLCGLDLGSGQDFTALAIVEQTRCHQHRFSYSVRHPKRFPAGTGFEEIAKQLTELLSQSPLRGCELILDITAVDIPMRKLIRDYRPPVHSLRALSVGTGQASSRDENGVWVIPRKELVSRVQILLQSRRLKNAKSGEKAGRTICFSPSRLHCGPANG